MENREQKDHRGQKALRDHQGKLEHLDHQEKRVKKDHQGLQDIQEDQVIRVTKEPKEEMGHKEVKENGGKTVFREKEVKLDQEAFVVGLDVQEVLVFQDLKEILANLGLQVQWESKVLLDQKGQEDLLENQAFLVYQEKMGSEDIQDLLDIKESQEFKDCLVWLDKKEIKRVIREAKKKLDWKVKKEIWD